MTNHRPNMPRLIVFLLLIGWLLGCVSAYDPQLQLTADLIVVSGIITDQDSPQTITLSRLHANADSSINTPIRNAQVEVLIDGTGVMLSERDAGTYILPEDVRGKVGSSYQLRFRTEEGVAYQSTVETMVAVPTISRVYDMPHTDLIPVGDTVVPASDIFFDYQDPPGTANFYLWRWRNYESQDYCASCRQGRYTIRDIGPVGSGPLEVLGCVVDPTIRSYVYYDYPCRGQCWDIFYSTTIDVLSDVYTNGTFQLAHKAATIPAYQASPALIVIEQLSLSANAYRYYRLFADQVQNTGTLADSPPAPLVGNVTNTANPQEQVVGYFSAASVASYSYKFTRQRLNVSRYIGLFRAENGRQPRREEERTNPIFGTSLPSALCIPSHTRTDQLPPGWNQ